MDHIWYYDSPLGRILIASGGETITGLWFEGQKHFGSTLSGDRREAELPVFGEAERWLDLYFAGVIPGFTPPLDPVGTPFRRVVWNELLRIPYGKTASYGDIAKALAAESGKTVSARAVGGAVGHNPISVIIPCHRVVGSDGSLTGYAGGFDRKKRLLALESAVR